MIKKILDSRWVEVVDVFRVEAANINAGEGGPAEIDIKTIHLEDGTTVPRISPQAIFRMVRDYWIDLSTKDSSIKVDIAREEAGKPAPLPICDPKIYIDDDLFGYLMARAGTSEATDAEKQNQKEKKRPKGKSEARPGPIRSIGAIGLFEYPDDTDFLTSIVSTTGTEMGGSMVTRRIYTNTFVLPIWCDISRIGKELEPQKDKTLKISDLVDESIREKRLKAFFEALFYLGKATPGSSKPPLSPKLIMVGIFSKPNISLYDALQNDLAVRIKEITLQREKTRTGEEKIVSVASGKVIFSLEAKAFIEKCKFYADDIIEIHIGIMESFFDKAASQIQENLRKDIDGKEGKSGLAGKIHVKSLETLKNDLLKSSETK